MPHFVYIMYSETRDRYHIGSCTNLEIRLNRHNVGATISTKNSCPWKIVYHEIYPSKTEALKREIHIKKMKSHTYIEDLIIQSAKR